MELAKECLGKVAITVEKDYHDINKAYDRLVIVEEKGRWRTYISRKPVPVGVRLNDREYWIPFSSLTEELITEERAILNKLKEYLINDTATTTINKLTMQNAMLSDMLTRPSVRALKIICENCQLKVIDDNDLLHSPIAIRKPIEVYDDSIMEYSDAGYYSILLSDKERFNEDFFVRTRIYLFVTWTNNRTDYSPTMSFIPDAPLTFIDDSTLHYDFSPSLVEDSYVRTVDGIKQLEFDVSGLTGNHTIKVSSEYERE